MSVRTAFEHGIRSLERVPATAVHVVVVILMVAIVRGLLESFVLPEDDPGLFYSALPFLHFVAFYAGVFFLFLFFLRVLLPQKQEGLRSMVMLGMLAGLLPPLIDLFLPTPNGYYTYFFEPTWHFFTAGQPLGESMTLWFVVIGTGFYAYLVTRQWRYFIAGALIAYGIFQFGGFATAVVGMSLFHALVDALALTNPDGTASLFQTLLLGKMVFALLWTCIALIVFFTYRSQVFHFVAARFPYALIWGVLVLFGAMLGPGLNWYVGVEAFLFVLAFMLMQAENDYYDRALDAHTGRASVIEGDDLIFIRFFMVLITSIFLFFDPLVGVALALSFLLGFVYHHSAFRFKRHFLTASGIQTSYAFLTILVGASTSTVAASDTALLIAFGMAVMVGVFANIRDYKDFEGDAAFRVMTSYVILSRYGISARTTHQVFVGILAALIVGTMLWSIAYAALTPLYTVVALILICLAVVPFWLLDKPKKATTAAVISATLACLFFTLFVVPLFI